jgi:hypothetical protein
MSGLSAKLLVLLLGCARESVATDCDKCIVKADKSCNEQQCFGPCGFDDGWTQAKCNICNHDCR